MLLLIAIGVFSFISFGLTGEREGRAVAWLRFATLFVASASAVLAGILLLFQEPWTYEHIATSHGRRGQILVAIIDMLLAAGPQMAGAMFILTGIGLAKIIPALWRHARSYSSSPQNVR